MWFAKLYRWYKTEAAFITNVERRIQAATYDADRLVPIFWDTETTGYLSLEWWDAKASRIVQLGALTDRNHGSFEFKRDINPYPVAMSPGAAETTHLSTQQVWSSHICPQVCSPCIRHCLPTSYAHRESTHPCAVFVGCC